MLRKQNPWTAFYSSLTDIWREKNPMSRQFTYKKRQTNNFTKSRLDLFLLNNNSKEIVRKVGIGWVSTLSDHRPIYIHSMLSRVQRWRGLWRLDCESLKNQTFVFGCNKITNNEKNHTLNIWPVYPLNNPWMKPISYCPWDSLCLAPWCHLNECMSLFW